MRFPYKQKDHGLRMIFVGLLVMLLGLTYPHSSFAQAGTQPIHGATEDVAGAGDNYQSAGPPAHGKAFDYSLEDNALAYACDQADKNNWGTRCGQSQGGNQGGN